MFTSRKVVFNEKRDFKIFYKQDRDQLQINRFPSNFITTSRYNMVTFIPFSLLTQFRRYANIYFLIIAIIQSISILSPLNPFSAIAPLVFVLGLSMAREGYEDILRHRSDNEVNSTPAISIKNNQRHFYTWADINVGDLLLIEENQSFPADLVVLSSSINSGACYIETSSLDGEKNLKPKSAILDTQQLFPLQDRISEIDIMIEANIPTQSLHEYEGSIVIQGKKLIMGPKQLLLRGAYLRNTEWVLGVVVYTGQDTKIMRNAEPGRIKTSSIESTMNNLILGIMLMQTILASLSAILSSWWLHRNGHAHFYLEYGDDLDANLLSFYAFFSYFLLYNTMIPISLIVSLEFVKVFQSYFMMQDEEMYVASRNKYAKVQTTTINEELGQVEYVFSDKTGTLTCNQMEFKYCVIGNILYGKNEVKQEIIIERKDSSENRLKSKPSSVFPNEVEVQAKIIFNLFYQEKSQPFKHSVFNFQDEELTSIINDNAQSGQVKVNLFLFSNDNKAKFEIISQRDLIFYYFFLLSSAHECLIQKDKLGNVTYQGPSPDEITLVDAAAHMGFKFEGASASEQTFNILNQEKKVQLLNLFEFNSDRKRMSVIIRDGSTIKLLIKGADNIIRDRLKPKEEQPFFDQTIQYLEEFSKIGLRCLMMATKILSETEYEFFNREYNQLADCEDREVQLNNLTNLLERDLILIGATAVEDKLQDRVPETIADMLRASIKVWMLTGDKLETAENIARSCKLIQGDMSVFRMSEKNEMDAKSKMSDIQDAYDECIKYGRKKSFLVEGESLSLIINNKILEKQFVGMAKNCESVVCCRVTPKQKAQVVKLIKDNLNKITLAIGDGANDVNMIQEAHIGIGLYGNEGMRAVQSSDFALGEFRCLWRLLFVHGHWSYIRISEMILYFFYKNMIFTIPQFYFAFFSAFSAQTFFDDWYITFYNMAFTALPLIIRGTFDQDVNYRIHPIFSSDEKVRDLQKRSESYLKNKFPLIYYVGQQKTIFTIQNYIFWAFQGLAHGLIIFFYGYWTQDKEFIGSNNSPAGLAGLSITLFSSIVLIADVKICMYTKFWTWFNAISVVLLSLGIYFGFMIASHYWYGNFSEYTPATILRNAQFYLVCFILTILVFLFDLIQGQLLSELFKSPIEEMRQFSKYFNQKLQILFNEPQQKLRKDDFGGSFWGEAYKMQCEEERKLINFEQQVNDS